MATKKTDLAEDIELNAAEEELTYAVKPKKEKYNGPVVSVYLPALEGSDTEGIKVDQYEHVTIANEKGEKIWHVKRGVHTEVPVDVFLILKQTV